jgi:hypothetical protein
MADTVDAIGYKTDVKSRASDYVSEKKDAVVGKVTGVVPDTESVKQGGRKAAGMAQQNPLGLAVAGAAVGFLVGLAIPSTRMEDEKMGTVADDLKQRAKETGHEALDRGKQVAQETAQTATETAKEQTQQHGDELSSSLKESAQEVASGAQGQGGQTGEF